MERVARAASRRREPREWPAGPARAVAGPPRPGSPAQGRPLYVDPAGQFSIPALVFGPRQSTPVHDHAAWCLVGVYEGEEQETEYSPLPGPRGHKTAGSGPSLSDRKQSPKVIAKRVVSHRPGGNHLFPARRGGASRRERDVRTGVINPRIRPRYSPDTHKHP
jgi:hypothetical protein